MNRSRRLGTVVATATIATMALASCGSGANSSSNSSSDTVESSSGSVESIKVVIADYSKDHTAKFWNAFAVTYEETTGIKMDLQIIDWNVLDQQSSTMIQTGNPPDILNLNAFASYAADGLLYNSDEVLSAATMDDIMPAFVESGSYDGKFYGMPSGSSVRALFYNKDLFAQASIEAPPTTRDEFAADAKKIAALGNGVVGYAQPLGPEAPEAEFAMWLINNGGNFMEDGKWTLNSPENVETLEFMKNLSVTDAVTQNNPGSTNRTDGAFPLFQQGKAGMVIGFGPLSSALDTQYPDVEYGIAPMPSSATGGTPQTFGVTDYLMSFKKDGNQEAVSAFYDLYYSSEMINTWLLSESFLPVTETGLEVFAGDPSVEPVYLETLPNVHLAPTGDPEWDRIKLTIQQNIGLAVAPDGDPKQFLDDLQAQAEAGK